MKLRTARRLSQVFFFALFLFFVVVTDLRYLKGYPVSLFLELDPLVSVATAITTSTVYIGLLWSLLLIVPTLLFGRIFCNWICPYGILHHVTGWLIGKRRAAERERIEANRYQKLYALKYVILIAMIVAALLGTLQIGLLDPICLFHRSMTVAILPMINQAFPSSVYIEPYFHAGAAVVGFLLLFFVGMNLVIPRFFCRVVCPLGAFLGTLSSAALWRIDRDPAKCVDCDLCLKSCEGASDPHTQLRKSECFVCFNCIEDCPEDALSFKFMPSRKREVTAPVLTKRRALLGSLIGVGFFAFGRSSGSADRNYSKKVIRPPGSVAEKDFLERCIKCDQCIRVCPTNVLQPTLLEAGVEGFWTPILNMKLGYCELNCTLCGQVCPTGAIQRVTIEEKTGVGTFAGQGPIRLGTAFYDHGRCLPWSMETPCVVCEEVCPVSPKAIYSREVTLTRRDGTPITLRQPYVDPALCIGCGICEHECPVTDEAAIRVTAIGETRSRDRRLLMDGGVTQSLRELGTKPR
ncbi:MAG: 4Fe-4S dicluster domain-containing protein [Verrucomicrobia bacterium]|nr:4Fe-4S dicluster domain-containing protein [Verrucomicrobiota bacterium]